MGRRIYPIIALAVVFPASFVLYLFIDFTSPIVDGTAEVPHTDAIVVLTGGTGRAGKGLDLFRGGVAGLLVISGVNEGSDLDSIFMNRLGDAEKAGIILEKRSKSTYENALQVRKLAAELNINSITLITSTYHMKRARYIFARVMPPAIRVEARSVSSPNLDEAGRWSRRRISLSIAEFLKFHWFVVRFALSAP